METMDFAMPVKWVLACIIRPQTLMLYSFTPKYRVTDAFIACELTTNGLISGSPRGSGWHRAAFATGFQNSNCWLPTRRESRRVRSERVKDKMACSSTAPKYEHSSLMHGDVSGIHLFRDHDVLLRKHEQFANVYSFALFNGPFFEWKYHLEKWSNTSAIADPSCFHY